METSSDQDDGTTSPSSTPTQQGVTKRYNIQNCIATIDSMDRKLIKYFSVSCSPERLFGFLRPYWKIIELSGHAGVWLILVPSLFFLAQSNNDLKERLLNFQLVLLVDVAINAILKGVIRRPRPEMNCDDQNNLLVDKYSMPSGHSSRAILVILYTYANFELMSIYFDILKIWFFLVLASRICLARHYPTDLAVGILIGFLESFLINKYTFWVNLKTFFKT